MKDVLMNLNSLARIPFHHGRAEISELLRHPRRARMVRLYAACLRGEAEGQSDVEVLERPHLPVEPGEREWTVAVRPAEAGAELFYPEPLEPLHGVVEPVVLEVEPLADA